MITQWQSRARCIGTDPDLFFPAPNMNVGEAKAICAGCPVRTECLEFALADGSSYGVYGGTTKRERQLLRSRRVPRCGTRSGYQAHRRSDQEPCDPCRDANNTYHRARWRDRAKRSAAA